MRRIKSVDQKGFSLIEIMIAVGLVSLIALSFGAALKMTSGAKAAADQSVSNWSSMAVIGTNFSQIASASKFSTSFLHVPITANCVNDQTPCLRLSDGTSFTDAPAGSITQNQIEFYSDADANLKNTVRILKRMAATDTNYTTGDIMSVTRAPSSQNQLQVTFPLVDNTSPPFPMIVQKTPTQFLIPNYSAQSDAVPGTWIFIKLASGLPIAGAGLKNELIAFYSAENPRLYTIQAVLDAKDCSSNMPLCVATVGAANAADISPSSDAVIKISAIDASHDLSNIQAYLPPSCSPGSAGCWSTDFSALGAFPSISTTVTETGLDYFASINFDPRKLLHYFHSSGIAGNLQVAPVQLVSYRINGKSLVRDVYHYGQPPGSDRNSVLGDLKGAVMFSRALGSGDIQLTQFKKVGIDPTFKHITQVMTGTSRGIASSDSAMNRKTVIYPKECDMTFSATPYCGDGDVVTYSNAHPNEKFLAAGATSVKVVLGYWLEPSSGTPIGPTAGNWFSIGYDDVTLSAPHVGLKETNSNDRKSGSKLLKAEVDRLVGLSGYLDPSQSYDFYSVAMACETYEDTAGTTGDPDHDSYTSGAQVCAAPVAVTAVPDDYGVPPGSVTCPSPYIDPGTCPGGSYSYSYATDAYGTTSCSTAIVCPSSVPTTGTPVPDPDPGNPWGGSCFEAGTKITMSDGSLKNIEDIKVGEQAVSYDERTGDIYDQPVSETLHHQWKWEQVYHIKLANGQTLDVNQVHGLFVVEANDYVKVKFLAPQFWAGQKLSLADESGRPVAIVGISAEKKWTHLYNLHMVGFDNGTALHPWGRGHNYFANGVLVHNMNNTMPKQ